MAFKPATVLDKIKRLTDASINAILFRAGWFEKFFIWSIVNIFDRPWIVRSFVRDYTRYCSLSLPVFPWLQSWIASWHTYYVYLYDSNRHRIRTSETRKRFSCPRNQRQQRWRWAQKGSCRILIQLQQLPSLSSLKMDWKTNRFLAVLRDVPLLFFILITDRLPHHTCRAYTTLAYHTCKSSFVCACMSEHAYSNENHNRAKETKMIFV